MLYRVAELADWQQAQQTGTFASADLAAEGFIHTSELHQLVETANRYYAGRRDVLLLELDEDALHATGVTVKREWAPSREQYFAHVFGPIPLSAVARLFPLRPGADGRFTLPWALQTPPTADTAGLQYLLDRVAVQDVILRFNQALDQRDWHCCRACFTDRVATDYFELRGEAPAMLLADDFVAKRRAALELFRTQHFSTSHLVTVNGDEATCESQAMIYRFSTVSGVDSFHTQCRYTHSLRRTAQGWKISGVQQRVVRNFGNAELPATGSLR